MKKKYFPNHIAGRTEKTTKPKIFSFSSHNLLKAPHYPHSSHSIPLTSNCKWCDYERGLVIIRWQGDKGFCRCGRCDAALFSIKEIGGVR